MHLYDPTQDTFVFSGPFSDLTVGYVGLFTVEGGLITASSVDGCCVHIRDTYAVERGKPMLVERMTEETTPGDPETKVTTARRVDGTLIEITSDD